MISRRNCLQDLSFTNEQHPNASLYLNKYIDQTLTSGEIKAEQILVKEISSIQDFGCYDDFYSRWKRLLIEQKDINENIYTVKNRLAINLGAESVLETSIALNYTYGVPYIPGSAIKGLVAFYARTRLNDDWKIDSPAYVTMFGKSDQAGIINFYDALYIPQTGKNRKPLWPDIMTPHHMEYFNGKTSAPADWDNPTPINFLTATGSYHFLISGPIEWTSAAFEILTFALEELGIGAKTNLGYGRMFLGENKKSNVDVVSQETYEQKKIRILNEPTEIGINRGDIRTGNIKNNGEYAFITPKNGGQNIFVHKNDVIGGSLLQEGMVLEYSIGPGNRGGSAAKNVKILLKKD